MNILVIGSGGREHAIGLAVKKSPRCTELHFAPGNPGMAEIGTCHDVAADDVQGLLQTAKDVRADLTIVGPEIPLVAGVVDLFEKEGLLVFGPSAKAAQIEGSKAFSKDIMKKYDVPTAAYEVFTDLKSATDYVEQNPGPIVVKASGLAAGKGAVVCENSEQALLALNEMLGDEAVFGESGKTVVIEEMMSGEEASVFAVCDGQDYVLLATAQDHKRIFDEDKGPNTGGMGAYAPAPVMTADLIKACEEQVIQPTLKGMDAEGAPYKGILYVGLMMTPEGPKVVEYNCRLGDPEAQVVLPLLEGDALDLFELAAKGEIRKAQVKNKPASAAIVVLAAAGYPGSYPKGDVISGLDKAAEKVQVIHAGTRIESDQIVTAGGRVLGIVGEGADLQKALDTAYEGVSQVHFQGMQYRKDIGKKGLKRVAS